jgi:hypothetical protein
MRTGIGAAVVIVGKASVAAIVGGGVLFLLGLIGLALLLVSARDTVPARRGFHHHLLIISSALFLVIGGLVLLGAGVLYPLKALRVDLARVSDKQSRQENVLAQITRMQSAQMVQSILSRPKYDDPKKLNRYEFKVFSQNGEDGIVAEIFRRISTTNRYFVEFGSGNGSENNTALLLRQGWTGFWIDGDTSFVNEAKERFRPDVESNRLTVKDAFITAENIEDLFRESKVPEEFDLLSIDIDRNDYYVWEKISHHRPRAVVIEYNSTFPPMMSWVVPYDPKAWGWSEYGNGASLKALEELGTKKGYSLVGCELCGVNAFFVRNDLLGDHFAAPYTTENHYEPFRWDYPLIHRYEIDIWNRKPKED